MSVVECHGGCMTDTHDVTATGSNLPGTGEFFRTGNYAPVHDELTEYNLAVDGAATENLPPLEFGYTAFNPSQRRYQTLNGTSGSLPDRSLAHPDYEKAKKGIQAVEKQ